MTHRRIDNRFKGHALCMAFFSKYIHSKNYRDINVWLTVDLYMNILVNALLIKNPSLRAKRGNLFVKNQLVRLLRHYILRNDDTPEAF